MLLGPHEIARRLEYRHQPGWSVWYGAQTRQFWAVACWVRTAGAMFGAATPEALAIIEDEWLPPPRALRELATALTEESAAHCWERAIRIVRAGHRPVRCADASMR
jgi:hypothetical protein